MFLIKVRLIISWYWLTDGLAPNIFRGNHTTFLANDGCMLKYVSYVPFIFKIPGKRRIMHRLIVNDGNFRNWNLTELELYFIDSTFQGSCTRLVVFLCCVANTIRSYFTDNPDRKVHGANMGPIWDRQDPGGPHAGPMNLATWEGAIVLKLRRQRKHPFGDIGEYNHTKSQQNTTRINYVHIFATYGRTNDKWLRIVYIKIHMSSRQSVNLGCQP